MSSAWSSSLNAASIRGALSPTVQAHLDRLEVREHVVSTNDILHAEAPGTGNWVQIAHNQSGARGRQGRRWEMSEGSLCFSILHHFSSAPPPALTLRIGISLAECLRQLGLGKPCLIWPNDLAYGTSKFGGILTECRTGRDVTRCVIGVGLNVDDAPKLDRPTTSICLQGFTPPEPNHLTATMINAVCSCLARLESGEAEMLNEAFIRYDGLSGCEVNILGPQNYVGIACGVNADGCLQVKGREGLRCFDSSNVRLMRA